MWREASPRNNHGVLLEDMIAAMRPCFECVAARQQSTKRTSLREFWFGFCCSVCFCVLCCCFYHLISMQAFTLSLGSLFKLDKDRLTCILS